MKPQFHADHFAISVRDIAKSREFYQLFGFEEFSSFTGEEYTISHLRNPDGMMIELFEFYKNSDAASLKMTPANDLDQLGVKHLALRVDDLAKARDFLRQAGHETTEPQSGRSGAITYCFLRDPDGIWLEILDDNI